MPLSEGWWCARGPDPGLSTNDGHGHRSGDAISVWTDEQARCDAASRSESKPWNEKFGCGELKRIAHLRDDAKWKSDGHFYAPMYASVLHVAAR